MNAGIHAGINDNVNQMLKVRMREPFLLLLPNLQLNRKTCSRSHRQSAMFGKEGRVSPPCAPSTHQRGKTEITKKKINGSQSHENEFGLLLPSARLALVLRQLHCWCFLGPVHMSVEQQHA